MSEKKVGLVVNPIAGMGGKVGLKGTDEEEILEKAKELGAEPVAPERAIKALIKLKGSSPEVDLLCGSGAMGGEESEEADFDPIIIDKLGSGKTTSSDTERITRKLLGEGVDIVLFAGGDGTARDVMNVVGKDVPILGVPTGVKMHSAVFANTPEIAGRLVGRYLNGVLPLREAEVMDVDEEAFRYDRLETDLKGFAETPYDPRWVQAAKSPSVTSGSEKDDQEAIARWVVEQMEEDKLYILGPGTTTRAVAEELELPKFTLLGVDLIKNDELVASDVREEQIFEKVADELSELIISPIGKQGFILGRGNQQISPRVVKKIGIDNIQILATPNKLSETPMMKIDTGDSELDDDFRGYKRVIMGYKVTRPVPVM